MKQVDLNNTAQVTKLVMQGVLGGVVFWSLLALLLTI